MLHLLVRVRFLEVRHKQLNNASMEIVERNGKLGILKEPDGEHICPVYNMGSLEDLAELGHEDFTPVTPSGAVNVKFLVDLIHVGLPKDSGITRDDVRTIPVKQMVLVFKMFSEFSNEFEDLLGMGEDQAEMEVQP